MIDGSAAALAGLIGMGEAIRARRWKCPTCRCRISIVENRCACCADSAFWAEVNKATGDDT